MSEQQQPAPKPAPQAPSFGELLEATLTAVPYPGVFVTLAQRPAPGYVSCLANLLIFWSLALGIRMVRELVAGTPGFDATLLLVPAALALFAVACFSVPGAAVVHALALLSGGQGDFNRSYQLVSMISSVAVIDALLSFAPGLWFVRSLIAAWLLAEGAMALHKAQPPRARTVFAFLAAAGIAAQWQAQKLAERAMERQASAILQQSMRQLTPLLPGPQDGRPAGQPSTSLGLLIPPGVNSNTPPEQPEVDGGPGSINPEIFSNIRRPSASSQSDDPAVRGLQQQTLGMLDALKPLLNNPQMTAGLSAGQKKHLNGLLAILEQQKQAMASGQPISPAQQKKNIELMMELQTQLMGQLAAPPLPPAKKKENR
jgi:hypothetical protein